ncbi:pilin [Candidatus Electrothrix sp.]|uniref:pilin n=1 Tax=Candidatus Electrothrix sp. TaxID=2170559 RepID=UPI004055E37D
MSDIRRYTAELLLVVVIIALLSVLAVRSYQIALFKAEVMGAITGVFYSAKQDSLIYLALHGEFPKNTAQALSASAVQDSSSLYYESLPKKQTISIEHGAVQITFNDSRRISGKTLTMRPVVQDDDPTGAVHWVYGRTAGGNGWKVYGIDRTDLDDKYIPAVLK